MKVLTAHSVLLLIPVFIALCMPTSLAKTESKEVSGNSGNSIEGRGILNLGIPNIAPFRPFMRVLGMMGIPLLPLLFIRQLFGAGAAAATANAQGVGGGAGMGSMGALGVLAPFGAGAGLGGIRPLGAAGGLRPLAGLRPGAFRPGGLGGLIASAANVANNAVAPTGGSMYLKRRSVRSSEKVEVRNEKKARLAVLKEALTKLDHVTDMYDLSVPDCQRLVVCELNKKTINPKIGSFTDKLFQVFGVEGRLDKYNFTANTKAVIREFLGATRNGLQQRDCQAIYYRCPTAVSREEQTNVPEPKPQPVPVVNEG